MKRSISTFLGLTVALALFVMLPVVQGHAEKSKLRSVTGPELLTITIGKGDVIDIPGDIADVLIANPSIVDVVALQSRKLYVVGSNLGDTNITLLSPEGGVVAQYDVHVKIDERAVQDYLDRTYPDENVKVKALNGQIMLTGTVSNPSVASKISQIVTAYLGESMGRRGKVDEIIVNLLQVTGEQQVMLKVKIFEVSKTLLRELGLEMQLDGTGRALGNNLTGGFDTDGTTNLTQNPLALGALVFNDGNFGPLSALARALEDEDTAHILAEPNLTAISGEEAGFLAGGEFPVPGGRDDQGNVIIQFRTFGVSLNFRPVVLSESRISLQLNTEVSSLSRDQSVTIAGLDVPGLNVRRASTTVEVPSGGGLMIAGLLESQAVKGMSGLPGIREVPVLGDLVSSRSFNRDESELIVIINAYLVKPYAERAAELRKQQDAPYRPIPIKQTQSTVAPTEIQQQPVMVSSVEDMPSHPHMPAVPAPEVRAIMTGSPALKSAFSTNIRRIYGRKAPPLLDENVSFGYLID